MKEMSKIILSLSASGTLLMFVLLIFRPLLKDRLSKSWQYYIWIVVIARLLIPFAPKTNLVGSLFQVIDIKVKQTNMGSIFEQDFAPAPSVDRPQYNTVTDGKVTTDNSEMISPATVPTQNILIILWNNLSLIWLVLALILLIRKITIYQSFVKYIRAGCTEVEDIDKLEQFGKIIERDSIKGAIDLCTNSLVSTPLMIGFLRPCIVLPTTDLSPLDFGNIILHELTHYRRGDMFYKWLVQLVVCLHWFNPFVYLMSREISRACELSCDEAVIGKLDTKGQRDYGDTLLNSIGIGGNYKDSFATVTLNESKEILKERLDAIVNFKRNSRICIFMSTMLTIVFCFGATVMGAYIMGSSKTKGQISHTFKAEKQSDTIHVVSTDALSTISTTNVDVSFSGISISAQGPVGVELVKTHDSAVSFELLGMNYDQKCTTSADIVDGVMQITVSHNAPNGLQVNFAPNYKNVVRINIPDMVYTSFVIVSKQAAVQMQDFNAPVHISVNRAGFKLIDADIAQGTYNIDVSSGIINIEAETIRKDITASVDKGSMIVCFNKAPANLYLDSTNCGTAVERPNNWGGIYRVGNEMPKIILSNTDGKTTIEAK